MLRICLGVIMGYKAARFLRGEKQRNPAKSVFEASFRSVAITSPRPEGSLPATFPPPIRRSALHYLGLRKVPQVCL